MPVRKDYILRLIEEFFKILAQILHLRDERHYQQAMDLIDETAQSLLKVDIQELTANDEVWEKFTGNRMLSSDQLEILAELLKVKADIHVEMNQVFSARNAYEKSLFLFEDIQTKSRDYSLRRANHIQFIKDYLMSS